MAKKQKPKPKIVNSHSSGSASLETIVTGKLGKKQIKLTGSGTEVYRKLLKMDTVVKSSTLTNICLKNKLTMKVNGKLIIKNGQRVDFIPTR
jgi:hypothetical protein